MKKARRILIGILAFVAVFFAGDRLCSRALDYLLSKSHFRYSSVYYRQPNADILVLGNSRAVNSFYSPTIEDRFGVKCLNLAYNGMSPDLAHAILLDYLDRNAAPQLVILEATCVDNKPTCVANFKPFWHHSSRLSAMAGRLFPKSLAATHLARLYAFNCELFLRAISHRSQSDQTWINHYAIDDDLLAQTDRMQPVQLDLATSEELAYVRQFAATAKRHKIDCQIVIAPYLPAYRAKLKNFDEWKGRIESAVPVVDLSSSVTESQFFADRLHTNYAGREAVVDAATAGGVFECLRR